MGVYADYYGEDYEYESDILYKKMEKIESDLESGIWTTKSGNKIKISSMSNSHLRNSYNFFKCLEKSYLNELRVKKLKAELKKRGVLV